MRPLHLHLVLLALPLAACEGDFAGADDDVTTLQSAVVNGPAPPCVGDTPGPYQVFVYRDSSYRKECRALSLGFYPTDGTLALPHDSISSFKVGSMVRFRAFRDETYGGSYAYWGPNTNFAALGSWDDAIGSARVELASRRAECDDVQEGEFALFEDFNFKGDCVVLSASQNYPTPKDMGFEDDSVSSVRNRSSRAITLHPDPWFGGASHSFRPYVEFNLSPNSCFLGLCTYDGDNDEASSVSTYTP
jgi:hypothetical protein